MLQAEQVKDMPWLQSLKCNFAPWLSFIVVISEEKEMKKIIRYIMVFGVVCICIGFSYHITVHGAENKVILLDSYKVSKGDFTAGTSATISFWIKNASKSHAIKGVVIEYYSESLTPVYKEDNQEYVDHISPGQKVEVQFDVDLPSVIEGEKVGLDLKIKGIFEGEEGESENNMSVSIPIQQSSEFVVNNVSIADSAVVGSKALISISYSNQSDSAIKDVVLHIDGDILEEQKEVKIGNMESGASQYQDVYIEFNNEGEKTIILSITYLDSKGKEVEKEITTETVNVIGIKHTTPAPDQQTQRENDDLLEKLEKVVVLGLICVVGAAIVWNLTRKKE